jgi:hypothetical protein
MDSHDQTFQCNIWYQLEYSGTYLHDWPHSLEFFWHRFSLGVIHLLDPQNNRMLLQIEHRGKLRFLWIDWRRNIVDFRWMSKECLHSQKQLKYRQITCSDQPYNHQLACPYLAEWVHLKLQSILHILQIWKSIWLWCLVSQNMERHSEHVMAQIVCKDIAHYQLDQ